MQNIAELVQPFQIGVGQLVNKVAGKRQTMFHPHAFLHCIQHTVRP
nr:MAG TPA: hypothetical protein [Caudoviricetes sp.]